MSDAERIQQQVFATVVKSGLEYREHDDFIEILAPAVEGENQSTAVRVRSAQHSNGNIVVYMVAPVVIELPLDDNTVNIKAHLICNRLNQDQILGRWVYYPDEGSIFVEHELIAEDLDPSELTGAVATVGYAADSWDDFIQEDLGAGKRIYASDTPPGTTS